MHFIKSQRWKFYWNMFPRVQLNKVITSSGNGLSLDRGKATSHYLNQWWQSPSAHMSSGVIDAKWAHSCWDDSGNDLAPNRLQAISWTKHNSLFIGPLETHFKWKTTAIFIQRKAFGNVCQLYIILCWRQYVKDLISPARASSHLRGITRSATLLGDGRKRSLMTVIYTAVSPVR